MFFEKRKSIRFHEETIKQAKEILKYASLDYNSFSDIVRAGINLVYRLKVKKDLEVKSLGGTKWEY